MPEIVTSSALDRRDAPTALYNAMVAPLVPYANRGFIWYQEKFDLEAGIRYSFGRKSGDQQQINLSDPKDYRLLQGVRDYSATSRSNQFNITFGFTYKFPRI